MVYKRRVSIVLRKFVWPENWAKDDIIGIMQILLGVDKNSKYHKDSRVRVREKHKYPDHGYPMD